jgi:hypothetical protein
VPLRGRLAGRRIIKLALAESALSPRELAVRFTDTEGYFVSEAGGWIRIGILSAVRVSMRWRGLAGKAMRPAFRK